jgi:TIR domain
MKVTVNAGTIAIQNNADVMHLGSATTAPVPSVAGARSASAALAVSVSHSSSDRALTEAMSELLSRALLPGAAAIRCTSVDGHRLPAGAQVGETLRADIRDAAVFVALVTPRSLSSPYLLFELGAR